MHSWPAKDPGEMLDYQFNWTQRLEQGETITSSLIELLSGDVTLSSESYLGAVTTVWISGGTVGTSSVINNKITTSDGRVYEESAKLRIREK